VAELAKVTVKAPAMAKELVEAGAWQFDFGKQRASEAA
jgi:hypothetical protein